jgi:hypothetical protein
MKREDGARDRRRDRDTYQSCLIPDVLAHLAHATRRGGRCVCVVRLLRNGSKTKFFQQPGRFQARTPFPLARPGRASRKPPGTRVTPAEKGSRYMAQRTEPHGATLRSATSGVAGCCCHPCLCKCVQCRATNGTAYPILLPLLGLISPRTPIYGVGGTNHGSSLACAAVLEGSRQTWGGQSSWSIGRTTD